MKIQHWAISGAICLGISLTAGAAVADDYYSACSGLPSQSKLQMALDSAVTQNNGGLGFNMWATLVANDGTVCAVAVSGSSLTSQWLGSRIISAQKANTANDFNTGKDGRKGAFALSTANLYSAVQPGGSLYGLQHSNPVDPTVAYQGDSRQFGTANDPLVGTRVGGVNVFGGGLGLYKSGGAKVGGVGVSGDTSCTDHMIAWRVRNTLGLDHLGTVGGVAALFAGDTTHPDNIIFDITPTANGGELNPVGTLSQSTSGFGHPTCLNNPDPSTLPPVQNP
jgi:uncharacterized protein GlcG (DUF336 family)